MVPGHGENGVIWFLAGVKFILNTLLLPPGCVIFPHV